MSSLFKKAQRQQARLKLTLMGPSGSGKTFSSLKIAKGLGAKKIAVIDTENESSNLYADQFDFDVCPLYAPYTSDKYIQAIKAADAEGYDMIIVDSATHQWMGEGGLYERKNQYDSRGGNSFTNWANFTPEHNKFLATLLSLNAHLICTVRSKQDYVIGQNEKGKAVPQKVGLAPVQRDGFEYEFDLVLNIDEHHFAKSSKDRTNLFPIGNQFQITEDTGKTLHDWLATGVKPWRYGFEEREKIKQLAEMSKLDGKAVLHMAGKRMEELKESEYLALLEKLKKYGQPPEPGSFDAFQPGAPLE